jgi:hypothetical protein
MGLFDAVHGVPFFHEVSGQQALHMVASKARRDGAAALRRLNLGSFDLAIDLRYDGDTRALLRSFDADIYAGFTSGGQFPFLDIALPIQHDARSSGPEELLLVGNDFTVTGGPPASSRGHVPSPNLAIAARRASLVLNFEIEGASSPAAHGISSDARVLGIRLTNLAIDGVAQPLSPPSADVPSPVELLEGWGAREPPGIWSISGRAALAIARATAPEHDECEVVLELMPFVPNQQSSVDCAISDSLGGEIRQLSFKYPPAPVQVRFRARSYSPVFCIRSKPFRLRPGRYGGIVRVFLPRPVTGTINLALRGDENLAVLWQQDHRLDGHPGGPAELPIDFVFDHASEEIRFELSTEKADRLTGVQFEYLAVKCREPFADLGLGHREQLLELLVFRVAQEFSGSPRSGGPDPAPSAFAPAGDRSIVDIDGVSPSVRSIAGRLEEARHAGRVIVGIGTGCNTALRKWPLKYFQQLAERLCRSDHVHVVFLGSQADRTEALHLAAALDLDEAEHCLCGRVELAELGLVLGELDLFIGNNSGITHFAGRAGVRTFGIYAGTNHPREWAPVGDRASWIYRAEPCSPCHLSEYADCKFGKVCMVNLMPDEVMNAVRPDLDRPISVRSEGHSQTPLHMQTERESREEAVGASE